MHMHVTHIDVTGVGNVKYANFFAQSEDGTQPKCKKRKQNGSKRVFVVAGCVGRSFYH